MTQTQKTANQEKSNSKSIIKDRYEIDFSIPLAKFNNNNSLAYRVFDISNTKRELFGLVSNSNTPPRLSILPSLVNVSQKSIINLVDYATIYDETQNKESMVLIYQKPQGPKILDISIEKLNEIKKDKEKLSNILLSLFSGLEILKGHGITHRAIRPDNLYFFDENLDTIVLGDCASCFPGFLQPPAYETIEASTANNFAKGDGSSKDDFYSIAASLLSFFANEDISLKDDKNLISQNKQSSSSFEALKKSINIPSWVEPIIKGLLDDNPQSRWQYIDVYNTIKEKKEQTPRQSIQKIQKPLIINNKRFETYDALALFFAKNIKTASEIVYSKAFLDWIKKNSQTNIHQKIIELLEENQLGTIDENVLISKVCILLSPKLPIFYKNTKTFPQGIAKAIFYCLYNAPQNTDTYKEIINYGLLDFWYSRQEFLRAPTNIMDFASYINSKKIGFGIKRVLYDFDADIPCLSPLLGNSFVYTAGGVLRSLERNIENVLQPYDNDLIAYLRCKLGTKIDNIIKEINSIKENQKNLAVLKLFVELQNKFGPKKLTKTTKIMADFCAPLVENYHNKQTRKEVMLSLEKAANTGVLFNIFKALENKNNKQADEEDFNKIRATKISLIAQKKQIELSDTKDSQSLKNIGIKLVMTMSLGVALLMFVISLFALI